MKKIEGFEATAPKSKNGNLEYCLWTDDNGALFFQITKNNIETKKPGTHSNLLFRISDYLNRNQEMKIIGFNLQTKINEVSHDNNDEAFIKAIVNHLLPNL